MKKTFLIAFTAALFVFAGCEKKAPSIPPTEDSSQFVNLTDAVPDAILEIRYYGTYNFVGARIDGYEQPTALLTKKAAEALKAVSDDVIAKGYRLKIYDAYRPQKGVDHFVRWAEDLQDVRMKPYFYPDLDKSVLFDQEYIMLKSGHTRGSTVDLTLFDMNLEKEVDMGGTFDWFGPESHPDFCGNPDTGEYTGDNSKSPATPKRSITPEQFANRMILRRAMLSGGTSPSWKNPSRRPTSPSRSGNFSRTCHPLRILAPKRVTSGSSEPLVAHYSPQMRNGWLQGMD